MSNQDSTSIPAGLAKMREPFSENQISKMCRSTKKENPKGKCPKCNGFHGLPAIQLDYVGHAAVTNRLLDADPNWTWEPLAFGPDGYPVMDKDGGMWIRLTVCGVTRLGYGDAPGKSGGDAMKERIGDAIRNASMRFGAALDLWHKGTLYAEEDEEFDILTNVDSILASANTDDLKKRFTVSYRLAEESRNKDAMKAIIAAKDRRKAELEKIEIAGQA